MTFKPRSNFGLPSSAAGIALVVILALAAAPAQAQRAPGSGDNDNSSSSSSNQYTLTKPIYDQVIRIQKLLGDKKYAQAVSHAKTLLPKAHNASPYAEALVNQLIAQAYLLMKEYDKAERYLEKIIELNALQPRVQRSMIYQLATIYLSQKKYDDSIRLYKQVLAQAKAKKETPDPRLYYRLGLAYSFDEKYQQAYNYIHEAIQKFESAPPAKGETKPSSAPKDWYQSLFIVVYKMKNYDQANDIAKTLVAKWPGDKDFWKYYANTFLLMHDDRSATTVYALMHKRGMLEGKDDYLQLVSLYVEQKAPYKAGELLVEAFKKGIVSKTADNYDLLAGTWMQAQAWDKALAALGKEAQLAPTGDIYLRQASIYLSQREYGKAVNAARNAIDKGGLKDTGRAWLILGQAAFRSDDARTALDAFHHAANYSSVAKNARNWIKYVQSGGG